MFDHEDDHDEPLSDLEAARARARALLAAPMPEPNSPEIREAAERAMADWRERQQQESRAAIPADTYATHTRSAPMTRTPPPRQAPGVSLQNVEALARQVGEAVGAIEKRIDALEAKHADLLNRFAALADVFAKGRKQSEDFDRLSADLAKYHREVRRMFNPSEADDVPRVPRLDA